MEAVAVVHFEVDPETQMDDQIASVLERLRTAVPGYRLSVAIDTPARLIDDVIGDR